MGSSPIAVALVTPKENRPERRLRCCWLGVEVGICSPEYPLRGKAFGYSGCCFVRRKLRDPLNHRNSCPIDSVLDRLHWLKTLINDETCRQVLYL